jgi:hypothetical protein
VVPSGRLSALTHITLQTILAVTIAAGVVAPFARAQNFPFKDPRGFAAQQQAALDRSLEPTTTCRVVTAYAIRCVSHLVDVQRNNVPIKIIWIFTKPGPHKIRVSVGTSSRVHRIPPGSVLYGSV